MKKLFIIFAVVICLFVLSRCATTPSDDIETNYITDTSNNLEDEKLESDEGKSEEISFDYTDIHFTHSPSDLIKISITYPQFKDERLSNVNEKIAEYAKSNFLNIVNDEDVEHLELTLEETHTVKLANEKLISISSTGELTEKNAAYPSTLKNALNIQPIDLRKFKITELINVSDEFIQKFKENASSNEQFSVYLSSFSDEDIKAKITEAKIYFDNNDVNIIFEVPHALGDFVEIKFDEEIIKPFIQ